jgi:para-aminobenzoate synthetase/4-amino-4-deoxychorismate lyase
LDEASGAPVPLLVDRGDEILEAGRANLFAAFGDVLKTPPVDGRILPGITRAATIEVAPSAGLEVREEPLSRAELLGADEVFLTGSVRGIEPARALDGASLPTGNELGSRLGEKLLRRWRTAGNLPSRAPLRRRAAGPRSGPPAR